MSLDGDTDATSEKYQQYENILDELEVKRCRGAAITSRGRFILEGEKSTAFFLDLQKQKQNQTIKELKNQWGEIINSTEGIINKVHEHCKVRTCPSPVTRFSSPSSSVSLSLQLTVRKL